MALENRYDFIMLFDVENGNPNGDPDAGNAPRIDSESGYGYVTDVCLKRKIRNYVELVKEGEAGYNILIKPDKALNSKFTAAYEAEGLKTKNNGRNEDDVKKARAYMCKNYYDVRTFGAVMSTGNDHWFKRRREKRPVAWFKLLSSCQKDCSGNGKEKHHSVCIISGRRLCICCTGK